VPPRPHPIRKDGNGHHARGYQGHVPTPVSKIVCPHPRPPPATGVILCPRPLSAGMCCPRACPHARQICRSEEPRTTAVDVLDGRTVTRWGGSTSTRMLSGPGAHGSKMRSNTERESEGGEEPPGRRLPPQSRTSTAAAKEVAG
jgi:hypothetical protein